MRPSSRIALLSALVAFARAHEGHGEDKPGASYMERHMASEHHIDSFDQMSFFSLHDLNRDGILDRKELEAIYGLHHETSREGSNSDEHHSLKTDDILRQVLAVLDKNGDGIVTKREFLSAGPGALPNFEGVEGLGHHYNSEGEYWLHHEELYHNTPETQTDESYTHPEDLAHFAHHEEIEAEEDKLANKAQGLDENGNPIQQVLGDVKAAVEQTAEQVAAAAKRKAEALNRAASAEALKRGPWSGTFSKPRDRADRLRYKYKMSRTGL